MSTQVFRINYKSDFVLNLQCDAGWAVPFTIKFWSKGLPTSHYFVSYDGTTYSNCSVLDDPTVLRATFDDHNLGCGELMFQITYSMDVDDFRTHIEDDVLNVSSVTIEQDGQPVQVVLNFEGETAPEIAYAMPAFAAEAARVAAEAQRVLAEAQREENELARQQAETQRQTEFDAAQEERREAFEQSQEEQDAAFNSAQQSRAASFNEQAADFESRYTTAEQRRDASFNTSQTARQNTFEGSERQRTASYQAAEGTESGSVAGDGSRWGEFKEAEAQRQAGFEAAQQEHENEFDQSQSGQAAAFSSAQQSRAQSFIEQAADFESRYTAAEQRRDTSFNASQTARQNTFEGSERQRTASYQAAEGTEAGSVAGDGSRWGEFKEAEAQRDTILNDKMQFVDEFAQDVEDNYAKKDGAYEEMLAGSALNLVDTSGSPVLREFTFDTSGGSDDIATGSALIKKMRGNTIVWNQLMQNGNFADGITGFSSNGTINISNGIATISGNDTNQIINTNVFVKANHKYIGFAEVKPQNSTNFFFRFAETIASKSISDTQNWSTISQIITATSAGEGKSLTIYVTPKGNTYSVRNVRLYDLTQMFGAGNEPSTVEEFEKLFPMPYYDYNEGQLLSFNGNSIKTVGFNQWDEEWETSAINPQTGALVPTPGYIASKNFIKVLPTTNYFAKIYGDVNKYHIMVVGYGANKECTGWGIYTNNTIFTIPDNVSFIRFCTAGTPEYGSTYKNDICINLSWSGTRNGTYEPYQEHVHDISFYKTIKDGDGNLLFPNGLLSAGSVYDEVTATKAIKRIGVVDLGTLGWVVTSSDRFAAGVRFQPAPAKPANDDTLANFVCTKYTVTTKARSGMDDKSISIGTSVSDGIYVKDTSYTDAASFKAAMQGVMLYYELAEPIEVDFEEQNMAYQVNDYGTEQLLPENTSVPTTTPAMLDVTYGINAVDTIKNLPRNYLAQDDLDRLLSAMGSALGFTYTKTWNETDKQWSFTVTKTATTNDENV